MNYNDQTYRRVVCLLRDFGFQILLSHITLMKLPLRHSNELFFPPPYLYCIGFRFTIEYRFSDPTSSHVHILTSE